MPLLDPDTCTTMLALLAALMNPATHDDAVDLAAQTSREAMVMVNAYDQHCEDCIAAVLYACRDEGALDAR